MGKRENRKTAGDGEFRTGKEKQKRLEVREQKSSRGKQKSGRGKQSLQKDREEKKSGREIQRAQKGGEKPGMKGDGEEQRSGREVRRAQKGGEKGRAAKQPRFLREARTVQKEKETDSRKAKENGEKSACPYAKKCGGCVYQGMEYAEQLRRKQTYVRKCVGDLCRVRPIIGMENPYHYRNKVHAVFDMVREERGGKKKNQTGRREAAPGTIISGVYAAGTHDVINVDACMIEDETASAIIRDIRGLLRSFKIKTYDEDTGYGLLRHVLVRRGFHSGEVMVVLVLGSPILPSKNNFIKAIRRLHPEITTIIINVNDKSTSMVLGEKEKVIYGKGYIEDTLCGCTFRISPKSFYQVNPVQTEILYNKAIAYAGLTGEERVLDAYCGIGSIGLIAAAKAREVIGVESNRDAVRDAIINAKQNQIRNVRFYRADAGEFMAGMAENRFAEEGEETGVDVVFLDPPRAGSDEAFLTALAQSGPRRVVYVSCNPETLARDLKFLKKKGYEAVECQPVDLFPWTGHVETVCLMSRKEK